MYTLGGEESWWDYIQNCIKVPCACAQWVPNQFIPTMEYWFARKAQTKTCQLEMGQNIVGWKGCNAYQAVLDEKGERSASPRIPQAHSLWTTYSSLLHHNQVINCHQTSHQTDIKPQWTWTWLAVGFQMKFLFLFFCLTSIKLWFRTQLLGLQSFDLDWHIQITWHMQRRDLKPPHHCSSDLKWP